MYNVGDYVKRGSYVFRVAQVFTAADGTQAVWLFGAWNILRHQNGDLIDVAMAGGILQPASKAEFIAHTMELKRQINDKLDSILESVE